MNVSVVIPVFNGVNFIAETLESIYQQTSNVHEVICIDDASSDDSFNFISKTFPQVKLLQNNRNEGPSYSRNRGVMEAKGSLVAFLDSDDKWTPDKIKWQCEEFEKDNSLFIVGGLAKDFLSPHSREIPKLNNKHFNVYLSSLLVRKTVFDKIGLFDVTMRLSEDQDWFLRVREAGLACKIVDRIVLYKRVHENNTTKGLSFEQSGLIMALKQSLDRRRASGDYENLKEIEITKET